MLRTFWLFLLLLHLIILFGIRGWTKLSSFKTFFDVQNFKFDQLILKKEVVMNTRLSEEDGYSPKIFRQRFVRRKDGFRGDVVLDVVRRNVMTVDDLATQTLANKSACNHIPDDIWFHISKHIEPENVKTFALICRQTAALVRTKQFWKNLLKQYCNIQNYQNPEVFESIKEICDLTTLRYEVTKLLFSCYKPFIRLVQNGYSLDYLIGRSYVSSWHKQHQCIWIMCYKFWNHTSTSKEGIVQTVNNWESLADDYFQFPTKQFNSFEGFVLLVISCHGYVPFPTQLLYENCNRDGYSRFVAARELLTKDIRSINLELDFQSSKHKLKTTIRYPSILNYKVLPWWHPEFQTYIV